MTALVLPQQSQFDLAHRKVLVLNKSWVAIGIIALERAIAKVAGTYRDGTPKARIIDMDDYQSFTWEDWSALRPKEGEVSMRSVNSTFRIPEVIQYTRYDKMHAKNIRYNRRAIYKRDEFTCQYCGVKKPNDDLSMDHVTPKCQGGLTTWENIVVACVDCNAKKAGRTPAEAGMRLLKKPVKPKYSFYADVKVDSWQKILGEMYWCVPLENDNK